MFKRLPRLMNERDDEPEESAGFDWAEIGAETSKPEQNAAAEGTATPSGTPPPTTVAPPAAAPSEPAAAAAPSQPAVKAPEPTTVAPTQPTAPVAQAPASPPQALTPTQTPAAPTQEQIAEWRGKMLEQLRAQYALKPDQVNAMLTEPETVLPGLLAEVHLRAMEQLAPTILQRVPQVIEQMNAAQRNLGQVGKQFVDRWPELKPVLEADTEKLNTLGKMAQVYRQLNPTAPTQDLIEQVGAMALVQFRVQPQAMQQQPQPVATSAPPFVPAGQSAARAPTPAVNIFEALALSSDTDDEY